ncbi:MAG: hypothetical protein M3P96_06750 [Actinomycetota bacterium]|nr:hypothetical protein [Actinomycetota bacterium]
MTLDDTAVEHFRQGRAALARKRDELDAAISQVDRILALLTEDGASTETASTGTGAAAADVRNSAPSPRPGGTRAEILDLVADGHIWHFPAILLGLRARGNDSPENSVRSLLTKMVRRDGVLINPSRGAYQLASAAATTDTEGVTADTATPSDLAPAEQEGGGADGTGTNRVRDDNPLWQAIDRDHGHGAPVVGA